MPTPFGNFLAKKRGETPLESDAVVENAPISQGENTPELPPMMKMLLKQLKLDPDKMVSSIKETMETVTGSVDEINAKMNLILSGLAAQRDCLNRYNDTLLLVLARLTEIESNHKHSPMNEFESVEPQGFEMQMCVECGHSADKHENGFHCLEMIKLADNPLAHCTCRQFRIESIIVETTTENGSPLLDALLGDAATKNILG